MTHDEKLQQYRIYHAKRRKREDKINKYTALLGQLALALSIGIVVGVLFGLIVG